MTAAMCSFLRAIPIKAEGSQGLSFHLVDYLEWVNWLGRQLQAGLPPLLEHLQINPLHWLHIANRFEEDSRY